jgi:hypothetical protein
MILEVGPKLPDEKNKMKQMHIDLPVPLYAAFHKLFPSRGEKTLFIRRVIARAIATAEDSDVYADIVLGMEGRK